MYEFPMWFGTFHHSEWLECPTIGSDLSARAWGSGGEFLSGGAFAVGSPDAYREYNLSWHAASTIPEVARLNAYRDGAYSKSPNDLFYFHDPLSYSVNVLPKRWAQPSLMARAGMPWAVGEIETLTGRGFPLMGAKIKAPMTDPSQPGPGVLFVPIPIGYTLLVSAVHNSAAGNGVYYRPVNADGSVGIAGLLFSETRTEQTNVSGSVRGVLLYFKGTVEAHAMRAVLYKVGVAAPPDFSTSSWIWHAGMGHSGCRFDGPPTYVPTNGVLGGMASYSVTLKEVGDWLQ